MIKRFMSAKTIICLPVAALLFIACGNKSEKMSAIAEDKDTAAAVVENAPEEKWRMPIVEVPFTVGTEAEDWVPIEHVKNIVDILLPYEYRVFDDEDPTKKINKGWVSLYKDSTGDYYIKQADYSIGDGFDECVSIGTKYLSSKDDVMLFMNLPNAKNGKVDHINISQTRIWPSDTLRFEYNGVPYRLYATGNKRDSTRHTDDGQMFYYNVEKYRLYLGTDDRPDELLLAIRSFNDRFMKLMFIGDIDGDGIPDFVFDTTSDYESKSVELFLSTMSEEGKITRKVARLGISFDC